MSAQGAKVVAIIGLILQILAALFLVAGTMPVESCLKGGGASICGSGDADSSDVTFGSDEMDGSTTAMIAFFLAIIAVILAIVGLVMVCKGNFAMAMKIYPAALGCGILVYIYMIPYEVETSGIEIEVSPGYGSAGGMETGALINFAVACFFTKKLAANPAVGGAPPVAECAA